MFKLVAVDNFDRENMSDLLIKENIATEQEAKDLAEDWNRKNSGHEAPRFCRVYPQDHELYTFEP